MEAGIQVSISFFKRTIRETHFAASTVSGTPMAKAAFL